MLRAWRLGQLCVRCHSSRLGRFVPREAHGVWLGRGLGAAGREAGLGAVPGVVLRCGSLRCVASVPVAHLRDVLSVSPVDDFIPDPLPVTPPEPGTGLEWEMRKLAEQEARKPPPFVSSIAQPGRLWPCELPPLATEEEMADVRELLDGALTRSRSENVAELLDAAGVAYSLDPSLTTERQRLQALVPYVREVPMHLLREYVGFSPLELSVDDAALAQTPVKLRAPLENLSLEETERLCAALHVRSSVEPRTKAQLLLELRRTFDDDDTVPCLYLNKDEAAKLVGDASDEQFGIRNKADNAPCNIRFLFERHCKLPGLGLLSLKLRANPKTALWRMCDERELMVHGFVDDMITRIATDEWVRMFGDPDNVLHRALWLLHLQSDTVRSLLRQRNLKLTSRPTWNVGTLLQYETPWLRERATSARGDVIGRVALKELLRVSQVMVLPRSSRRKKNRVHPATAVAKVGADGVVAGATGYVFRKHRMDRRGLLEILEVVFRKHAPQVALSTFVPSPLQMVLAVQRAEEVWTSVATSSPDPRLSEKDVWLSSQPVVSFYGLKDLVGEKLWSTCEISDPLDLEDMLDHLVVGWSRKSHWRRALIDGYQFDQPDHCMPQPTYCFSPPMAVRRRVGNQVVLAVTPYVLMGTMASDPSLTEFSFSYDSFDTQNLENPIVVVAWRLLRPSSQGIWRLQGPSSGLSGSMTQREAKSSAMKGRNTPRTRSRRICNRLLRDAQLLDSDAYTFFGSARKVHRMKAIAHHMERLVTTSRAEIQTNMDHRFMAFLAAERTFHILRRVVGKVTRIMSRLPPNEKVHGMFSAVLSDVTRTREQLAPLFVSGQGGQDAAGDQGRSRLHRRAHKLYERTGRLFGKRLKL